MLDFEDDDTAVVFETTEGSTDEADEAEDAVDRDVCESRIEELDDFVAAPLPAG
jgi:hypothetical protein